jgi:hypothetical protein
LRRSGGTGFPFERRYLLLENYEYSSFDLGYEERIRLGSPLRGAWKGKPSSATRRRS